MAHKSYRLPILKTTILETILIVTGIFILIGIFFFVNKAITETARTTDTQASEIEQLDNAGTNPVDSGEQEKMIIGGAPVETKDIWPFVAKIKIKKIVDDKENCGR